MKNEWLTFEQAGQLIDGSSGWRSDADGSRHSSQAFLMFAHKGLIGTQARMWKCRAKNARGTHDGDADDAERSTFLLLLFNREKRQVDEWSSGHRTTGFSLADECGGNFEVVCVEGDPGGIKSWIFQVVGLRFCRTDVETTFDLHSGRLSSPKIATKRLPEPLLAEWWSGLDEQTKGQPQDVLLELCQAHFPSHHIARDRIRELTPGRKRGRKPLRDKTTA